MKLVEDETTGRAAEKAEKSQRSERVTKRKTEQRGREMERWGRVYSSSLICCPFILRGSDQRCLSRSGLHILDWSFPGVPQTAPLCLGNLERELIVFKVPWQESDAHSRWVLSPQSAAGSAASTHARRLTFLRRRPQMQNGPRKLLHRSTARWFMRQWSTALEQCAARRALVSPEETHCRSWNFISCIFVKPPPGRDKKTDYKSPSLAESLEAQSADKLIMLMCQRLV